MRTLQITEYQAIEKSEAEPLGENELNAACFEILVNAITAQTDRPVEQRFFKIAPSLIKAGLCVQANNYVGYYKISGQSSIEVLPKIYSATDLTLEQQRRLLLKMLSTVYDLKLQNLPDVSLAQLNHAPLLELFIAIFLHQVEQLCLHGLKADYQDIEENEPFLRGRLLIKENIRLNVFNHANFYCKYQVFSENRPENRLILSALLKVNCLSLKSENSRLSASLLPYFGQVSESSNFALDLHQWQTGPEMAAYQQLKSWCQLLLNCHPMLSAGELSADSIMFPMERLFEAYVQAIFKQQFNCSSMHIVNNTGQGGCAFWLASWVDEFKTSNVHDDIFALKPDIVVYQGKQPVLILDAKWKLLEDNHYRKNIKESDVYQMLAYAYVLKPTSGNLCLIFPRFERFEKPVIFRFNNPDERAAYQVSVIPFDLYTDTFIGIENWQALLPNLS